MYYWRKYAVVAKFATTASDGKHTRWSTIIRI